MKIFLLFVVFPFVGIMTFFSGALPYTLIRDEASLVDLGSGDQKPLSAMVVRCELPDTAGLRLGSPMKTTFRMKFANRTNRFVAISALGEVFDPKGRSGSIHSKLFVLSPNAVEEKIFRSRSRFSVHGKYRCTLRYAIGGFD